MSKSYLSVRDNGSVFFHAAEYLPAVNEETYFGRVVAVGDGVPAWFAANGAEWLASGDPRRRWAGEGDTLFVCGAEVISAVGTGWYPVRREDVPEFAGEQSHTCACGHPATTEIQTGWDRDANRGIYAPVCDHCYAESDEAQRHPYRVTDYRGDTPVIAAKE